MLALRVALICAAVPVSVTLAVPLPAMMAEPPVTASMPWATARVTVMLPLAASVSATLRPVITLAVSSAVVCATGTVLTGASLTALTVRATLPEADLLPPAPVLPPSATVKLRVSLPLVLSVGV